MDLARTEEMPALSALDAELVLSAGQDARAAAIEQSFRPQMLQRKPLEGDVFLARRTPSSHELPALSPETLAAAAAAAVDGVTLFVYGWDNVQPGPLSWAFPSLRAALSAVRIMRNAIAWCIVSGREPSVDAARAKGAILVEQSA